MSPWKVNIQFLLSQTKFGFCQMSRGPIFGRTGGPEFRGSRGMETFHGIAAQGPSERAVGSFGPPGCHGEHAEFRSQGGAGEGGASTRTGPPSKSGVHYAERRRRKTGSRRSPSMKRIASCSAFERVRLRGGASRKTSSGVRRPRLLFGRSTLYQVA